MADDDRTKERDQKRREREEKQRETERLRKGKYYPEEDDRDGSDRRTRADPIYEIRERVASLETKITWLLGLSGVTIVVIVSLAFWLGSTLAKLDATLAQSSQKTDKVYETVLTNSDNLNTRTSVIETKIDAIDKKLPARP